MKFKATTHLRTNLPVVPNLLNQQFTALGSDTAWVAEINYIHADDGGLYLAIVLDPFNRKVVGSPYSQLMTVQTAIYALKKSLGG